MASTRLESLMPLTLNRNVNMIIYPSSKVLPYVYTCTHKESGKIYIGYRCANKLPSHLDLPKYRTSSKIVKPKFKCIYCEKEVTKANLVRWHNDNCKAKLI